MPSRDLDSRDGKINRRRRYDTITMIRIPYMSHTYPGNQSREGVVDRGSSGQERLERVIATER